MAITQFEPDDIIRLLEAILPSDAENPFELIEEKLLQIQTDQVAWETFASDRFDSLEARTFGILILQLIRTIKIIFTLIPGGQFIIVALMLFTLIDTFLDEGSLSVSKIIEAVEESGLLNLLKEKLEAIQAIVDTQADKVETMALAARDAFFALSKDAAAIEGLATLPIGEFDPDKLLTRFRDIAAIASPMTNLAFNSDQFIGPILAEIPGKIRAIPALASKLAE